MDFFKRIFFLSGLVLLSGCATYFAGDFHSGAQVNQANFRYVKSVNGSSQATYICGIGGMARRALVDEARVNLYYHANLQPNQVLTNVTIDHKKSFTFL